MILADSLAAVHRIEDLANGRTAYLRTRSEGEGGITAGPETRIVVGRTLDGFPIPEDVEDGQI